MSKAAAAKTASPSAAFSNCAWLIRRTGATPASAPARGLARFDSTAAAAAMHAHVELVSHVAVLRDRDRPR